MAKFFILGENGSVKNMFIGAGWKQVLNPKEVNRATLVVFTGGEDVTPSLYGEGKHTHTYSNFGRDMREAKAYKEFLASPKVGICRGHQFLAVMNGCKLIQHADGHAGSHDALIETPSGLKTMEVSSTHHQQVKEPLGSEDINYILLGFSDLSTYKEGTDKYNIKTKLSKDQLDRQSDVEAIYFPESRSLGFQFHPEFYASEMRGAFFDIIKDRYGLQGRKEKVVI